MTVAKSIEFTNRFQNMGAQLVRQVAGKTNDIAGDGTTTATVLARAIYAEGCKAVAAGLNPNDLRRGMQQAVEEVVKHLQGQAIKITSSEEIAQVRPHDPSPSPALPQPPARPPALQVGTISANGDREVGELLARAMEKVGKEGVITVQDGRTLHDELETVEGMKFDRGYISPYFVNDPKTQRVELEDAYILLVRGSGGVAHSSRSLSDVPTFPASRAQVEKKVSSLQQVLSILEAVVRENRALVIIAEDVESEALASLVLNKLRGGLKIAAVKAPGFGDNRKANLQDIAELTGGTVISEEVGLKLETTTLEHLGSAKKITISKDDTLIMHGGGSKDAIKERCEVIREQVAATSSEYEKEKLQARAVAASIDRGA